MAKRPHVKYVDERSALVEWQQLPKSDRQPGAFTLDQVIENPHAAQTKFAMPPEKGIILRLNLRALAYNHDGGFRHTIVQDFPKSRQYSFQAARGANRDASRDFLWLKESEWRSIIPPELIKGRSMPLPQQVRDRICLMHLVDGVRNLSTPWRPQQLRRAEFQVHVDDIQDTKVTLRLVGNALMATSPNIEAAKIGYDCRILGFITYDAHRHLISRFDAIVIGDAWDVDDVNLTGARPGRTPLGFSFELVDGLMPADRIAPGSYYRSNYFANRYPRD